MTKKKNLRTFFECLCFVVGGNSTGEDIFSVIRFPVQNWAWLSVIAVTGILAIISLGLLLHLLSFHAYLGESDVDWVGVFFSSETYFYLTPSGEVLEFFFLISLAIRQ